MRARLQDRILNAIDRVAEPIQGRRVGVHYAVQDFVKELVLARLVGGGMELVQVGPYRRALALLNGDQIIAPKKQIQLGNLQLAGLRDMYRLQHYEDIIRTFFDFGSLVPMAAILYVQRVKMKRSARRSNSGSFGSCKSCQIMAVTVPSKPPASP